MPEALLEMRGVSRRFGATVALDGVDLVVRAGEVHALVGENGAGKSTLMKVLSGAVAPDAGELRLDGEPFRPRSTLEARRAGIAMIYQELSLAPHLSAEENIVLGVEPSRWGLVRRATMRRVAAEALRAFNHPELRPETPVGRLPVAAQQLVEIARALASGSRVLVLDEPTSSLARPDVERLFDLIGRLRERGLAIVYISHFIEEVTRIADRLTVLRDGRVVGTRAVSEVTPDTIVGMMVGREVTDLYPRSPRTPGAAVLSVDDLAGRVLPVEAALELRRGEVLGIGGLVGAGRTELLRAIFGLDPVRSGTVRVGAVSGESTPRARLRQGVGFLSEDRKNEGLAVSMSLADNVTLSRLDGLGPAGLVWPSRQAAAAARLVDRLAIRCRSPRQPVASLSGGNQQKVAIARLLHHDVDVWLLDEPTRGIDVGSKAVIYRVIDELAAGDDAAGRKPRAILLVSSYFPELLGVCDRIAVMSRGRLGEARPVADWSEHDLMLAATGRQAA